jgi:NADPH-dependent ferric siderophore reductase
LTGPELSGFQWIGFDHWFRLFIPLTAGQGLVLPTVKGRSWWRSYLAIPKASRPHCANYTVADFRPAGDQSELDIDVVLHRDAAGQLAGRVAIWAVGVEPGWPAGLLDQGIMFDRPDGADSVHLVSDATGLPALRGITASLPSSVRGTAILEVPTPDDSVSLRVPAGLAISWVHPAPGQAPGAAALAWLEGAPPADPEAYGFAVGVSALAAGARRIWRRQGLPKSRITFVGYWKP